MNYLWPPYDTSLMYPREQDQYMDNVRRKMILVNFDEEQKESVLGWLVENVGPRNKGWMYTRNGEIAFMDKETAILFKLSCGGSI